MECFNGMFQWNVSMECFNGIFQWNVSMECFNGMFKCNVSLEMSINISGLVGDRENYGAICIQSYLIS